MKKSFTNLNKKIAVVLSIVLFAGTIPVQAEEITSFYDINSNESYEKYPGETDFLMTESETIEEPETINIYEKATNKSGEIVEDKEEIKNGGWAIASGKCGQDAYWELDAGGNFVISGNGLMNEYDDYYEGDEDDENDESWSEFPWEEYRDEIISVTVKEGITNICSGAFINCHNLTEVSLADSVQAINEQAFAGSRELKTIRFSQGLEYVGYEAFYACSSLYFDSLPASLKEIDERAFYGCKGIRALTLSSKITKIGNSAFSGCDGLQALVIEPGRKKLENEIFSYCHRIRYVYIPNTITSEIDAFYETQVDRVLFGGTKDEWAKVRDSYSELGLNFAEVKYNKKQPKYYTVSFDATPGRLTVTEDDEDTEYDVYVRILFEGYKVGKPGNDPELSDYIFGGWYWDKEGTREYGFGDEGVPVTEDRIIYAKWNKPQPIDINFYSDKKLYKTVVIKQAKSVKKPANPEKNGFVFGGWYLDEACTKVFDFKTLLYENTNLYAKWLPFDLAGHHSVALYDNYSKIPLVSVSFDYTDRVNYDGRKHVWKNGKTVSSAKVSPDIRIENLEITAYGKKLNGISIAKVKCINNVGAVRYDKKMQERPEMMLSVKLKYDKSDKELATILREHKNLKKVFKCIMEPTVRTVKSDGKTYKEWMFYPIDVSILPITVSSNTPLYTKAQVKADPSLQEKDGILIYDGKTKISWKNLGYFNKNGLTAAKGEAKGLTYQKVITLPGGQKTVKSLRLNCGSYKKMKDDGDYYVDMSPDNCDYIVSSKQGIDDKVLHIVPGDGNFKGTFPDIPL